MKIWLNGKGDNPFLQLISMKIVFFALQKYYFY